MTYIEVPLELKRFIYRNLMKKQKWSITQVQKRKEKMKRNETNSQIAILFPGAKFSFRNQAEIYFAQTMQR